MFGNYFERKRVVNTIIDELRFDTTYNNLPELAFVYEIKNHFLFIRRQEEPTMIVYNFEANTFNIPGKDIYNICNSGHYKSLLKSLIMAHAELIKRDKLLTSLNIPLHNINQLKL
jgi:hypothetical protein